MTSASNTGLLWPRVTPREEEILDLLVRGWPIRAIAKELRCCPDTVKKHLCKLYLKFGITSGAQHIRLAVEWYYRLNPDKRL